MKLLLLSKKIDSIKNILKPNSRIGFVGTAGEVYENPIWINEDKIKLQEFGYKIIDIDITNNSIETTIKQLENIDCLYIAGGNVYYLKQQIENKKLEEAIKKFIFSDKLYVGSSAGSCICSPNLEIYKTLDDQQKAPNIKSLEGLNVIDFEIIPHYGRDKYADRHKEIIEKYKSKYKLLTLEDKESILFKSRDTYKLIEYENAMEKLNVTFQKATVDEIDFIIKLYEERSKWFQQNNIDQWTKYLIHHPREEFEKIINKGEYYTLKNNGKIIGGFQLTTYSSFWNDTKTPSLYIYKIVTKVGYKNLGNLIFEFCKKIAQKENKQYLRLECLSTNNKLNQIYSNHGFKLIKTGEDYYKYALREYKI